MSSQNASANAAAAAAQQAEMIFFEKLDAATAVNTQMTWKYAAVLAGLILSMSICHWTRRLGHKSKFLTAATRPLRQQLQAFRVRSFLFLPARTVLFIVFFAVNATLLFVKIDWSLGNIGVAKRAGWMALMNICLTFLLALKNTPLSPIAGRSYDTINALHRVVGYTIIIFMILHCALYTSGLAKVDALFLLAMRAQYSAAVAGASLLIIGITASSFIRKRQYEMFYIVHVTLATVILITVAYHVNETNFTAVIIVLIAASLWFVDRSLRLSRWIYHGYGNYCTLTPLPRGATRVLMHRPMAARPGSHAFLWIPAVRAFQTHPLTLVSTAPAEFVVQAQNGFTKALHELALSKPGSKYRAAVEGPYGNVPSTETYDKTVLVGGGSGATFTMALAMDWLRRFGAVREGKTMDVVWVVRNKEYLTWFENELLDLQSSAAVDLKIFVTAQRVSKGDISPPSPAPSTPEEEEKEREMVAAAQALNSLSSSTLYGRPHLETLVKESLQGLGADCKVLVAASGPESMLDDARIAVRECLVKGAPDVDLHVEAFGW